MSLCQCLSCVDVIQSFTYGLRVVILYVTKGRRETARDKVRGNTNRLLHVPSKENKRTKQEFLAVASLLLLISNLLFPSTVYKMNADFNRTTQNMCAFLGITFLKQQTDRQTDEDN